MRRVLAFIADLTRRHAAPLLAALLAVCLAAPPTLPLQLPAALLLYTVAAHRSVRAAAAGGVATVIVAAAHRALWSGGDFSSGEVISTAVFCLAAVAFGALSAQRRTARLRERELLTQGAVVRERLRIARELHDAVGHDVSLMVVQAQALGATVPDPRVAAATDAIADLGRRTMRELHRTLALLRDDAATAPAPGLDALSDVLDGARAAGVPLTFAVEGTPRSLAPALDLSAFRIVQESVTNVVRHAGCAPAAVTVRYGADAVELIVADAGPGRPPGAPDGHGLVGMRERAALFGGTLDAGPQPGGGFRVRGVLPYEES